MNKPLPYPIPGPAGGLSTSLMRRRPSSSSSSSASSSSSTPSSSLFSSSQQQQQASWTRLSSRDGSMKGVNSDMDVFRVGAWPVMCQYLKLNNQSNRLSSSLAIVRRLALLQASNTRVSRLPVLIMSLSWVGADAAVTLRDPTATMRATIHAHVFEHFAHSQTPIRENCVLLLKDVSACAYEIEAKGFRVDHSQSVHLNVRVANVQHVFLPTAGNNNNNNNNNSNNNVTTTQALQQQREEEEEENNHNSLKCHPADFYTQFARAPPPPNIRRVLRTRAVNHNVVNNHNNIINNNINTSASTRKRPYSHPYPIPQNSNDHISNSPYKRPTLPPRPTSSFRPPTMNRPSLHYSSSQSQPQRQPQPQPHRTSIQSPPQPPPQPPPVSTTSMTQNTGVTVPDAGMDDHLDSLLGDFDMDAVIDTHRKSQALAHSQPHSQPTEHPSTTNTTPSNLQTNLQSSNTNLNNTTTNSTIIDLTSAADNQSCTKPNENTALTPLQNCDSTNPTAPLSSNNSSSADVNNSSNKNNSNTTTTTATTDTAQNETVLSVDPDVINNLLDGLCADDFT